MGERVTGKDLGSRRWEFLICGEFGVALHWYGIASALDDSLFCKHELVLPFSDQNLVLTFFAIDPIIFVLVFGDGTFDNSFGSD